MRILFALAGGAFAVVVITLIAVGIYSMFPNDDEVIPVTPIGMDQVITDPDFRIESADCECKSEKLETERQLTDDGKLGCKGSILSVAQMQALPTCKIADTL